MKMVSVVLSGGLLMASVLLSNAYAAEFEIKMLNIGKEGPMVFEPASLKVAVGDTVKFIPTDMGHDVVSVFLPKEAKSWKGDMGKEITVKIEKEGIYLYKCSPHVTLGMVGVIQAGEASNKEAALKAAKELKATMAMNKERLDKYLAALEKKEEAKEDAPAKEEKKKDTPTTEETKAK